MSDQLEVEAVETEAVEQLTDESSETVSEEAPQFTPEQHAAATNAFKAREAKREAEQLRKELDALKNKAPEQTQPVIPVLPDYPEPEELAEYTRKVQESARFEERQAFELKQQQNAAYQGQLDARKREEDLRKTFVDNSTKQGVKLEDLQTAANLVDSYGLSPQITQAMLADKDGGLMLLQLSTNPQAIQDLNNANVLTLGTIYADIKAKSAALKPKTSSAPHPVETLSGNGIPPTDGGPKGATYE
jgi:hypothetical protein